MRHNLDHLRRAAGLGPSRAASTGVGRWSRGEKWQLVRPLCLIASSTILHSLDRATRPICQSSYGRVGGIPRRAQAARPIRECPFLVAWRRRRHVAMLDAGAGFASRSLTRDRPRVHLLDGRIRHCGGVHERQHAVRREVAVRTRRPRWREQWRLIVRMWMLSWNPVLRSQEAAHCRVWTRRPASAAGRANEARPGIRLVYQSFRRSHHRNQPLVPRRLIEAPWRYIRIACERWGWGVARRWLATRSGGIVLNG